MVLLWAFFVLQGREFRCFEGYSFYHQWRFRLKITSLFGRNEAFYASKRSYFTGVKRLPERGRLLLRQGVSSLRTTFRACPKHLTGLRKIPFVYTQNRFVCFFITMSASAVAIFSVITLHRSSSNTQPFPPFRWQPPQLMHIRTGFRPI